MDTLKFGQFIAERRRELGLKQQELAQKLNVTDKAVSRWENGRGFPDINTLEPLAEALGVSVVELMKSERLEEPLTSETADTALADTIEMAGRQTKHRSKIAMILTFLFSVIGIIASGLLIWQLWESSHPEIGISFSQPYAIHEGKIGDTSGEDRTENWVNTPIVTDSCKSIFGMSKSMKLRWAEAYIACQNITAVGLQFQEYEPYLLLTYAAETSLDHTALISVGYYTKDGEIVPYYNYQVLGFKVNSVSNLPDECFEIIWEKFPQLKETYDKKLSTSEWKNLQN